MKDKTRINRINHIFKKNFKVAVIYCSNGKTKVIKTLSEFETEEEAKFCALQQCKNYDEPYMVGVLERQ